MTVARGFSWRNLPALARLGLPMGIAMLFTMLNPNFPRYFIVHVSGLEALAAISAMLTLTNTGKLLLTSIGQATIPRLARLYADRDRRTFLLLFWKLTGLAVLAGLFGLMIVQFAGGPILRWFFRPEYADHSDVFSLLAIAATLSGIGTVCGVTITAGRWFDIQLPTCALISAAGVLACWWLIPRYGVTGAGWAAIVMGQRRRASACLPSDCWSVHRFATPRSNPNWHDTIWRRSRSLDALDGLTTGVARKRGTRQTKVVFNQGSKVSKCGQR